MANTNINKEDDEEIPSSAVLVILITSVFAFAISFVVLTFIDAAFGTKLATPLGVELLGNILYLPITFIAFHLAYKYFDTKAVPQFALVANFILFAAFTASCLAELFPDLATMLP